jgi:hypothetical protein
MQLVTLSQASNQSNRTHTKCDVWARAASARAFDLFAAYTGGILGGEWMDLPHLVIPGGSMFLSQRWRCFAQMG